MYLIKQMKVKSVVYRCAHITPSGWLLSPKKAGKMDIATTVTRLSQLQTILYYKYLGFFAEEIKS